MKARKIYLQLQKAIEQAPIIPPCQTTDPEIWFGFADPAANKAAPTYRIAKQLCGQCPVQKKCLEYALAGEEEEGVWGGLTPQERRAMTEATRRLRGRPRTV